MNPAISRVFLFLLVVLGIYLWIGYSITALTLLLYGFHLNRKRKSLSEAPESNTG